MFTILLWTSVNWLLLFLRHMEFSIKDLSSKCDQIRRKLRIWSHLLERSIMENLIFCAVYFQMTKPKIIKYRNYEHIDNNEFRNKLIRTLSSNDLRSDDLAQFTNIYKVTLEPLVALRCLWRKGMLHIIKLHLWTKTYKKQLWNVPGC